MHSDADQGSLLFSLNDSLTLISSEESFQENFEQTHKSQTFQRECG